LTAKQQQKRWEDEKQELKHETKSWKMKSERWKMESKSWNWLLFVVSICLV
jgi:hypothetical protein